VSAPADPRPEPEALKPCPFCGQRGSLFGGTDSCPMFHVWCRGDMEWDANGCVCRSAYFDTAAQAIAAWNRRAPESHDAAPGEDGTATRKDAAPALEGVGFLGSPSPGAAPSPPGDVRAAVAHTATLRALFDCARAWEPNARLLGNVRAGDAVAALDAVLRAALAGQGSCSEIPKSSTPPGDRWTLLADNPETWPDNSCEMVCVSRLPGSRETWRATDLRGLVADGRAIGWRWHPWPPHAQGGGAG